MLSSPLHRNLCKHSVIPVYPMASSYHFCSASCTKFKTVRSSFCWDYSLQYWSLCSLLPSSPPVCIHF